MVPFEAFECGARAVPTEVSNFDALVRSSEISRPGESPARTPRGLRPGEGRECGTGSLFDDQEVAGAVEVTIQARGSLRQLRRFLSRDRSGEPPELWVRNRITPALPSERARQASELLDSEGLVGSRVRPRGRSARREGHLTLPRVGEALEDDRRSADRFARALPRFGERAERRSVVCFTRVAVGKVQVTARLRVAKRSALPVVEPYGCPPPRSRLHLDAIFWAQSRLRNHIFGVACAAPERDTFQRRHRSARMSGRR